MLNVTLFRDFVEDKRTSMEWYADNLLHYLAQVGQDQLQIKEYRPELGKLSRLLPERGNMRMRAARYIDYPLQVKKQQQTVNHILDHGYAHLLRVLDPNRTVVTSHDIIPLLAGQGKISGVRMKRRCYLGEYSASFLHKAAHIFTISKNTKKDLVEHCGCNPDNITVLYLGIDSRLKPLTATEKKQCRHEFGLPAEETRLVLITGQQFYKNQKTSLQVFERLQEVSPYPVKLVRLGRMTKEWEDCLRASRCRDHIVQLENLPPEKMVCLYNAVDCLLFPSWYEGFGWPPAEALACGIPVVVSDRAALPEAVGDGGVICPPDDVEGLISGVQRLLDDKIFRQEKVSKGLAHVQQFNWTDNARQVLKVYQGLC